MAREKLDPAEIDGAIQALDGGWSHEGDTLVRTVEFESFLTAVDFIGRLAPVAEELDHHPDLSLSWRTVRLALSTHTSGGVTTLDLDLAMRLDPLIAELTGA